MRYTHDKIYTYTGNDHRRLAYPVGVTWQARPPHLHLGHTLWHTAGKILVALNPFGPLSVYGEGAMAKYKDKDIGAKGLDPHVYAMGEAAFKHVKRHKTPAALIMSGESGAGKTETTKHLMRYLAVRAALSLSPLPYSSEKRP